MHQKKNIHFSCKTLLFLLLVLLSLPLFSDTLVSQGDDGLVIAIWDYGDEEFIIDNMVIEGKEYGIQVGYLSGGFAENVTVSVLGDEFTLIDQEDEIPLIAPDFEDYPDGFVITANKQGYDDVELILEISRGMLEVSVDQNAVLETEDFTVLVTDQDDNKIRGAKVHIGDLFEVETNTNGYAVISAIEVEKDTDLTITAFKEGYSSGSTSIFIENEAAAPLIDIEIDPVFLAILLVVLAILIVAVRKKLSNRRYTTISKPQEKQQTTDDSSRFTRDQLKPEVSIKTKPMPVKRPQKVENITTKPQNNSKIEEIRIQRPEKKRDTKIISQDEKPKKHFSFKHKKKDEEWFKGTDDVRYKIDRLTGEIDEDGVDKWFEGYDTIRLQIDEALAKKNKEKKKQNET